MTIILVRTALSYHSSLGCNKVVARQDKRFLLQPCYNLLHTKLQSSIATFGDLAGQMCWHTMYLKFKFKLKLPQYNKVLILS